MPKKHANSYERRRSYYLAAHPDAARRAPRGPQLTGKARRLDGVLVRADRMWIGARIREQRLGLHVAYAELAAATGLNHTSLMRIEKGERDPKLSTLISIARALDLTIGELLS